MVGGAWGLAVTLVAPFKYLMVWVHKRLECSYSCIQKMPGYTELPCTHTCALIWYTHIHAYTHAHKHCACMYTHVCTHMVHTYTHMHANTARMYTHMHTLSAYTMHTCLHVYTFTAHINIYTYV